MMKYIKHFENIEEWDEMEVSEKDIDIPEDGETIIKLNKFEWDEFVKICSDFDFIWVGNNNEIKVTDFDEIIRDGYRCDDVDAFDDKNIFVTLFSNKTVGFGYSDFNDTYDDYYYTLDEFKEKYYN